MLKTKNIFLSFALLTALIIGTFTRTFQLQERFMYTHDNDLNSWIVKDIVIDKHIRLIGQLTSAPGIFIGPLFYYSLIPFYLATGMDPIGSVGFSVLAGLLSIVSLYYVVKKLYSAPAAGIAVLIYASSQLISATEREVVPTTLVMLWSIWGYYAVHLVFQGQKKGFYLAAVLFSLVWHINLALILLSPIFVLGFLVNFKKFKLTDLIGPVLIFILLSFPLITFELRHGFIQTKALMGTLSLAEKSQASVSLPDKLMHVISYALKNANHIFWLPEKELPPALLPGILTLVLFGLALFKKIPRYTLIIFVLWMGLYIAFFTFHPINLSEYYLNGMNIFWLIIMSIFLAFLFERGNIFRVISLGLVTWLITVNVGGFLTSNINRSGYVERKAIVAYIAADAQKHNYPCISISYITNPGYNLGYRYFFYLQNMHVNPPISGSPVYTIVFPLSLVDRLDKTIGALGVINPDYKRYSKTVIDKSCSGQNSNLTDPMFGFTD